MIDAREAGAIVRLVAAGAAVLDDDAMNAGILECGRNASSRVAENQTSVENRRQQAPIYSAYAAAAIGKNFVRASSSEAAKSETWSEGSAPRIGSAPTPLANAAAVNRKKTPRIVDIFGAD